VFAVVLQFVSRSRSPWAFPTLLACSIALIDAFLFGWLRMPITQAQTAGWLLRAPAGGLIPALWLSKHAPHIEWITLTRLSGDYAALVAVTAISLLLGITSVEVDTNMHADIDVERELRLNGLTNLLAAIPGGMVGTLSLTRTLLNFQSGGRNRISGFIAATVCLLTLAFGTEALAYIPIPVLGGMLLYFGATLLEDWLVGSWKRMHSADFAQVCGILILIVGFGFLAGIAAGIVVACMTFAVSSSRVRLVKMELTRSNYSSRVDRPPAQNAELVRHGERIRILRLQGFMFFGSANRLLDHVKDIVGEKNSRGCRVVVLDFREVLGIDSTAVMSLIKLGQFAGREGVLVAVSALTEKMERVLYAGGFTARETGPWTFFSDLDTALEWAEDRLLSELMNGAEVFRSTDEWLAREFGSDQQFREFASYLETLEYGRGELLFRQGEPPDGLVLLHSGRVSVIFRGPDGRDIRVRSMVQQTILGEMGLYRARPRGASVYVEQRTVAYRLTNEALGQLELKNPALAHAFHKFVIRTLSDRLDFANREISALQQ
jgi:SulP family sulfate permease